MQDVHSLIGVIVVGVVTGWVASKLVHGKGLGIIPDMVVGIVGALLGGFLANFFNIPVHGWIATFCMYVLGAVVLLVILRLIRSSN